MSKDQGKSSLTKEELKTAKIKIKEFIRGNGDLMTAYGATSFLKVLANITDKLSRDNEGNFKPGWFYSYLVSNLVSGASLDLLDTNIKERETIIKNNISEKAHQIFDAFSIDERLVRMDDIDKALEDVHCMKRSAAGYLGAKSGVISSTISTAALVGMTMVSGGLASLPVMGSVILASGISSYFINRRKNAEQIHCQDEIRKANADFRLVDRLRYTSSYKAETSDPTNKTKQIYDQKRKESEARVHDLKKMLSRYAIIGTLVKSAVVAGVVAATYANPVNLIVSVAATLGTYKAVNSCVDSVFSLKRHIGNFANAYKSFLPKIKVKYGKKRIPSKANVIELDNVVVHRKDPKDPSKVSDDVLFTIPGKQYIGPGITLISGVSGAGKSTLINLLMHSRDVESGTIKIGTIDGENKFSGTEYGQLDFAEPSRHIAISMQKPEFMEMTVDEFIRMANPNAPEELVHEVMELVGIKDDPSNPEFISPHKVIKGGGQGISGGQANRLNLAQALIKDSPILILDEPTAGIDATMEENIAQYLNRIKGEKTIIYITHNSEDVHDLQIDQALDLARAEGDRCAVMTRYDLSDEAVKKEFLAYFLDRNSAPSPAPSARKQEIISEQTSSCEAPEEIPEPVSDTEENAELCKTKLSQLRSRIARGVDGILGTNLEERRIRRSLRRGNRNTGPSPKEDDGHDL